MQGSLRLLGAGPPGAELGSMRMGALDPKTGQGSKKACLKGSDVKLLEAIEDARKGVFMPNREQ